MPDNFWLSDAQWAAIAPHLPMVHTGPVRQDDRRIISGILHRLREGCRWRALPAEYGPYTTVFNRYNRWSKRGLWQDIFAALASCAEPPERDDDRQHGGARPPLGYRRKRMARPGGKQFPRANLSSLHQRIRSRGETPAKMEIRAPRAS